MTIAALLGHFGITVPRYVTLDGEIIFDGVTATGGGGYAHATHGLVTPVANHTFHGGEEEADAGPDGPTQWWDDDRAIARHIEEMEKCFPKFSYVPARDDLSPCWIGDINTGRGRFKVAIILRKDKRLPFVTVLGGPRLGVNAGRNWKPSPHLYLNDNLCVADQDDWKPDVHTAATVTAWTAHWLAAFTEWRITRRWPVGGAQSSAA
jgi:hypothetical protein